jgi:hypothetical protein
MKIKMKTKNSFTQSGRKSFSSPLFLIPLSCQLSFLSAGYRIFSSKYAIFVVSADYKIHTYNTARRNIAKNLTYEFFHVLYFPAAQMCSRGFKQGLIEGKYH